MCPLTSRQCRGIAPDSHTGRPVHEKRRRNHLRIVFSSNWRVSVIPIFASKDPLQGKIRQFLLENQPVPLIEGFSRNELRAGSQPAFATE